MSGPLGVQLLPVRTPTLPPATHTNCALVDGRLVVDPASPWEDEQQRLSEALSSRSLEAIFLTHHHQDHVGGARALAEERGLPILAHPRTAALCPGLTVDRHLDEGELLLGRWQVLHTPGHAPGHLCLWQPETGELVVGDMVASVGTIVLEPEDGSLADYLASLERLAALEPRVLYPAHGEPIHDAVGKLRGYIAHRLMRTEQLRAALPGPVELLVERVYADSIPIWVRPLAARQMICHLRWLSERGEAEQDSTGAWHGR